MSGLFDVDALSGRFREWVVNRTGLLGGADRVLAVPRLQCPQEIGGRSDRQDGADRLDSVQLAMLIIDRYFGRWSSFTCARNAAVFFKFSLAQFEVPFEVFQTRPLFGREHHSALFLLFTLFNKISYTLLDKAHERTPDRQRP